MRTHYRVYRFMTAAVTACGIAAAHACEDGMLVDYGGQSCYEGWNDYQRAQPPPVVAVCPEWHDETPGALGEHCPLAQAPQAPETMPDWYDEAPRRAPAPLSPVPAAGIAGTAAEVDEGNLARASD